MSYRIETMNDADWEQVRTVYLEGIATGNATFETDAPSWENWDKAHLKHSRLVAKTENTVAGWAALSPVSSRCVYGGVGEVSVYVGANDGGKGIGRALLEALIKSSEQNGIWTLQAGIFAENAASVKLHLRCGFREIGRRKRIGKLAGIWRDTIIFERRSAIVGID